MFVSKLQKETMELLEKLEEKYSTENETEQKEHIINDLYKNGYMFRIEGKKTSELLLYKIIDNFGNTEYSFVDILQHNGKGIEYQYIDLS